jgi:hypothetical protein
VSYQELLLEQASGVGHGGTVVPGAKAKWRKGKSGEQVYKERTIALEVLAGSIFTDIKPGAIVPQIVIRSPWWTGREPNSLARTRPIRRQQKKEAPALPSRGAGKQTHNKNTP